MKTALIVIDVQSYFMQRSPRELPNKIAEHMQKSNYDLLIFTIFQNKDSSAWGRNLHWEKCKSAKDSVLASEFKEFAHDGNTFTKTFYSAFKSEGFENLIKQHAVEKLVLCGVDLEGCVLATAYEAFDKGYAVEVLFDLSYSRSGLDEAARAIILRDIQTKN